MSDRFGMVLVDYKCSCTWVGETSEAPGYCAKHGEDARTTFHFGASDELKRGWNWETEPDPKLT